MKSADEIQRAHDLLVALILGDVQLPMSDETERGLRYSADVLCWVLEHDHNEAFAKNLSELNAECETLGYRLIDSGKLQSRKP